MPVCRPPRFATAFGLVACLAAPLAAQNLTLKKPPPLLSRAELRQCMDREDALKQRAEALQRAREHNEAAVAEISASAKRLSEDLRRVDPADPAAVDDYNRRAEAHDAVVAVNNRRADAYNAAVESLNSDSADQIAACATRPYLQADRNAILAERRKNGQAGTPAPAPERSPAGGRRPTSI
jgi:hypothetical protein